ncbi:MAG TPA: hypothetical protein VNZ02_16445, partial [Steroidobacteraceae bacterium]|nr:hypothetical protein [Steroidobacteraceae bacterium]
MADINSKPWRVLALRANFHLATARLLLDLALDGEPPEPAAARLRNVETEVTAAQSLVRSIAGLP